MGTKKVEVSSQKEKRIHFTTSGIFCLTPPHCNRCLLGLFKRAILQSGSIQGCFSITPEGGVIQLHTSDGNDQAININQLTNFGPMNQGQSQNGYAQSGNQPRRDQYQTQQGAGQTYQDQYNTSPNQPPYYNDASNQYNPYGQSMTTGRGYQPSDPISPYGSPQVYGGMTNRDSTTEMPTLQDGSSGPGSASQEFASQVSGNPETQLL